MKKRKLIALGGVIAVAGIGGTMAYFNQTLSVDNMLDTGKYDTELVEKFTPPSDEWEPGAEVDKLVNVKNTGDYPVVVRVKFDEEWTRNGEVFAKASTADEPMALENLENVNDVRYNKLEIVGQLDDTDGTVENDNSVVHKNILAGEGTKWVYNPYDGYYYYTETIPTGGTSDPILNSIQLCENVDMGKYEEKKYYSTTDAADQKYLTDQDWTEFAKHEDGSYYTTKEMKEALKDGDFIYFMKSNTSQIEGLEGYSNADYTLTVTAQTVQATKNAISVFGEDFNMEGLGLNWTLVDSNADTK